MKAQKYLTKFGFGGLLKEGLICVIVFRDKDNVFIKLDDGGGCFHGKVWELQKVN